MNERFSNELLSAWLDGELSLPERAQVERWLQQSPEARQELEELERVSGLVRSLPAEAAPEELLPSIMRQAERAVLIPSVAAPKRGRSSKRTWMAAVGGLALTTAAAVVLMLVVPSDPSPSDSLHVAQLDRAAGGAEAEVDLVESHDVHPGSGAAGAPMAMSRAMKRNESLFRDSAPAEAGPVGESLSMSARPESAAGVRAEMRAGTIVEGDLAKSFGTNWATLQIGDVVPYFETTGDRVAVVKVTVVDVRKAADTFQVLLAKNSVPPIEDESASGVANSVRGPAKPAGGEFANGLLALYVESTDLQLASALKELESDEGFLQCELQPPVPLEGVELAKDEAAPAAPSSADEGRGEEAETLQELVVRNRLRRYQSAQEQAVAGKAGGEAAKSGDAARSAAALAQSEARIAKSPRPNQADASADAAPAEAARRFADSSETVVPAETVQSFQMLVNVPLAQDKLGRAAEQQRPVAENAPTPAAPMVKKRVALAPQLFGTPAEAKALPDPSAVRVIFIFQDQDAPTQDG